MLALLHSSTPFQPGALCRIGGRFLTRRSPSHLTCSPLLNANADAHDYACASLTRSPFSARASAISSNGGGAAAAGLPRCESLTVPCRSNGSIQLDVFHSATPDAPVLLYLPAGPLIPECTRDEQLILSTLCATSAATVVRINYRASAVHQYPTPYHDVLFGYDWVRENLIRHELGSPLRPRLGVCGELLGGSLATMLALTECRRGLGGIVAAAVNNPIVDWVYPDDMPVVSPSELPEPFVPDETSLPADEDPMNSLAKRNNKRPSTTSKRSKRGKKAPPPTAWQTNADNPILPTLTLSGERDVLFRKSEDMFDRFASPIHFFRSPAAQLVYLQPDYLSVSTSTSNSSDHPDGPLDPEAQMALNHYNTLSNKQSTPTTDSDPPVLERCRSYARTFPPAGPSLDIPAWRISTGSQSPLLDQAGELTKMIRRSVARQKLKQKEGRARWFDDAEKRFYADTAEDWVRLDVLGKSTGLWTQESDNQERTGQVEAVGVWMKGKLERGDGL